MARRRYQDPEPERIGNWWYIRVRKDFFENGQRVRRQHREKLCSGSKKIREVRKLAADYLQSINQGLQNVGGGMQFSDYVDKHYNITESPLLASTTRDSYERAIDNHLKPVFGSMCFREITTMELQVFFSGMAAKSIEHPTRVKVRDALSSVLRSARRFGLVEGNPLENVTLPPDKRGKRKKFVITPEEFVQILAGIREPYATMVFVAVWTGLRVSELIGLKWRCIGEDSIAIEERYCRGDWSHTKSVHSAATIGVPPEVIQRINRLKDMTVTYRAGRATRKVKAVRADGPDDLIFQSVYAGAEMDDHNILGRHIKPAARAVGLGKVNWHCLRRSFLTWLVEAGADPKTVQALARHSRVGTTMDIYAQAVPEAQRRALRKLSQFVTNLSQKTAVLSEGNGNEVVTIQ
jgi:integrase